jgi:hypothetical protein
LWLKKAIIKCRQLETSIVLEAEHVVRRRLHSEYHGTGASCYPVGQDTLYVAETEFQGACSKLSQQHESSSHFHAEPFLFFLSGIYNHCAF